VKPKALPLVAFALLSASAVSAQTEPPAPPAPVAPIAASAPAAPVVAPAAPRAVAAAAHAPSIPNAPAAPHAYPAPLPAVAPELPAPPQEPAPAPPAVASTLFVTGNFLGVRTEEVTRENMQRYGLSGEPRGVGVREVVKGSPAEKAGLRANDVIVRFDGEPVPSVRKLTRLIEESAPEHVARITVLRGGAEQELSATLARREPFMSAGGEGFFSISPDSFGDAVRNSKQWKLNEQKMREKWEEMARKHSSLFGSTRRIGVTTNALGKQLADYFGVTHGVLVSSVEEGSPAEKAGLKAGDILTEADGQKVEDSDDLSRAIGAKQEGEVTLTVVRDRKQRTVRVTPERRATPQGQFMPGTFRLFDSPIAAAFTLPRIQMHPEFFSVPNTFVTPRLFNVPRVRVTPRMRLFGLGDRIL
jgi:serine protease Do